MLTDKGGVPDETWTREDLAREVLRLRADLHLFDACLLDKEEDRLWHESDATWWRRVRSGDGTLGKLVGAKPPKLVSQWKRQAGKASRFAEENAVLREVLNALSLREVVLAEKCTSQEASVGKHAAAQGHEMCHENDQVLYREVLGREYPKAVPGCREFFLRCMEYRLGQCGEEGGVPPWEEFQAAARHYWEACRDKFGEVSPEGREELR